MSQPTQRLFHLPPDIIGRERELKAILRALDSFPYRDVFYFVSRGGIGKTRLLLETSQLAQARPQVLETGVIDLYHGNYHQPLLMMESIVERLKLSLARFNKQLEVFKNFEQAAQQYRAENQAGDTGRRDLVEQAFLADYNALATYYSIVVLIDTFEKLHPAIEEAAPFNFRPATRLEGWLVDLLGKLPNTFTLIAGRPRQKQRLLLERTLTSRLTLFMVQPFTEAETASYIERSKIALPDDIDLPNLFHMLHNTSDGRPVILALALACAQAKAFDIAALPPGFDEPYPKSLEQLSKAFINLIIRDFEANRPELAHLLNQALYLRKGLYIGLLEYIAAQNNDVLDTPSLETFCDLPFVKVSGDGIITLHDEMYDLLFDKWGPRQPQEFYRHAIAYLDQHLDRITLSIDGNNPSTIQHRQTLQVERLFYRMALNPVSGYQHYRVLSTNVIHANEEDFDTQLQDELARFFEPDTAWGETYRSQISSTESNWRAIVYDEGVRWVQRRINTYTPGSQRYQEAFDIANRVEQTYPDIYEHDTLARCALDAARLEAAIYLAPAARRELDVVQGYEQLTRRLEEYLPSTAHREMEDQIQRENVSFIELILARAYNHWGYYDRTRQNLFSAIEKYKRAVSLFKRIGPEADSLRGTALNDLGFALAQQGALDRGLRFAEEAARIAKDVGSKHRFAISLNTMAQIKNELNRPYEALDHVREANQIFRQVNSRRNLALCLRAEGEVRRWYAYGQRADWTKSAREYRRAIGCYRQAMNIFDSLEIGEPVRQIEIRQNLGCAYRSRGSVLLLHGKDAGTDMKAARKAFNQALALCDLTQPTPIVSDILEDIAVTYVEQGRFEEALGWLQQAQTYIPPSYTITEGVGLTINDETRQQTVYWLRLGQIELQHALCAFGQQQYLDGCERLLRSFAAIRAFSTQAPQLNALRVLGRRELTRLADPARLKDLRVETYWKAQLLRIEDVFDEMEQIFEQVIEDIDLLYPGSTSV